jgi:hypothetical protein
METDPLYYPRPYPGEGPLDDLIAGCADHEGTSRVYWRKESIAVFEAMFKVGEGFVELFNQPVKFSAL